MTEQLLDVRGAAATVGRHPETIRRWVWSGRLAAHREGNRLLVAREDVEALAGVRGRVAVDLSAWAKEALALREASRSAGSGPSAADLVVEDRAARSDR